MSQRETSDSEMEYLDPMTCESEFDNDLSSFEDEDDFDSEKDVSSASISSLSSFEDEDYEPEDDVASPSSSAEHSDSDDEMEDEDYREVLSPEKPYPFPFNFQEESGPKHVPPPESPPIAYFYLFFTSTLLSLMVEETNRYAQQRINDMGNNVPSYLKDWTEVSVSEMKGFLACVLNMGLIKKPTIASYWSTSSSQAIPWFGKMFSRHRFSHLLRFFHLVDNTKLPGLGESSYDPCAKYQPLVDHANKVFRHHYTPHQEISVDESLVDTKNKTSQMQYLPKKKHNQWGIKFWMLCDSVSNYCLGFFTSKRTRSQKEKHSTTESGLGYTAMRILHEIGMYLNKGYHFFVDRYFTSVPLVRHLYSLQTYITGIVRRNLKTLPQQFKKKLAVGQTSYFRSGPVLAYGFRQKQSQKNPVFLLSSHAWARDVEVIRNGKAKLKPEIIQNYNKFMGGFNTSDMVLYTYFDEKKPVKYWKKVAFNIIARMVLNSYILYKENFKGPGKIKSRYAYQVSIIESLGGEWKATNLTENDPEEPKGLKKLPGRKEARCCVCSSVGFRRRSRTVCTHCNKGVHGECFPKHEC